MNIIDKVVNILSLMAWDRAVDNVEFVDRRTRDNVNFVRDIVEGAINGL